MISLSWAKKSLVVAGVMAGLAVVVPGQASAGIYTWQYSGTYSTEAACADEGRAAVSRQDADAWRCTPATEGIKLYLGTIW